MSELVGVAKAIGQIEEAMSEIDGRDRTGSPDWALNAYKALVRAHDSLIAELQGRQTALYAPIRQEEVARGLRSFRDRPRRAVSRHARWRGAFAQTNEEEEIQP